MHNDNDGAVPWYQGIEFFMSLRRLGKPPGCSEYNNEAHNLSQRRQCQGSVDQAPAVFRPLSEGRSGTCMDEVWHPSERKATTSATNIRSLPVDIFRHILFSPVAYRASMRLMDVSVRMTDATIDCHCVERTLQLGPEQVQGHGSRQRCRQPNRQVISAGISPLIARKMPVFFRRLLSLPAVQ